MKNDFAAGYEHYVWEKALVIHANGFEWIKYTSKSVSMRL